MDFIVAIQANLIIYRLVCTTKVKTKLDYAVKEMKEFDPDSYMNEKKVLDPGNSTWNNFFYNTLRKVLL